MGKSQIFLNGFDSGERSGAEPTLASFTITRHLVVNNKIASKLVAVFYTPGQLRSAISISPEAYRHWRKALSPLSRGQGHSPCFSSGDLIAVSVVRTLTVDLSVRVGALNAIAAALFEICNGSPWPALERAKLILDLPAEHLDLRPETATVMSDRPLVIVPLAPIIARLRDQLLAANDGGEQPSLKFPPTALGGAAVAGG
jgi:hypothetical protein